MIERSERRRERNEWIGERETEKGIEWGEVFEEGNIFCFLR